MLDYEKIKKLDGWGELSTNNLKNSIQKSKNIGLDKFIFSLGIRHIGQENAKLLAQFFQTKENFFNLTKKFDFLSLGNIDGIEKHKLNQLKIFFRSNKFKGS